MSPSVLVVDDQPQIREVLRAYLEADGFAVLEADTAARALAVIEAEAPEMILLDVGLPDTDGIEVLRQLRALPDPAHSGAYVMMVTARSEEVDKLVSLAVGADDYVTKPFSPRVVVARVKAILRRDRVPAEPAGLRFVDLEVRPAERELSVDGRAVELSALEFDLLLALAQAPGRVFSRPQLLEKVWGYDFFGDERVVDVHIRNLRRKLSDDAVDPRFIRTVRGGGIQVRRGAGMKRLSVRLFITHMAVALVGGLATAVLVRLLVPRLYDDAARGMGRGAGGPGQGGQGLGWRMRELIAAAVDQALIIGVLAGVVLAIALGLLLSWRLLAPLREMQHATRQLAAGDYRAEVTRPGTTELAELADDVNALAGALATTDARRVRLVSEVAHEMRTPLTVIDGYVEGMIDGVFVADPQRLGQISTEVRKLRRLADDLSTLSRVEEGRLELELAQADLGGLVERAAARFEPQFEEAGVALHTLATGKLAAEVDADRIGQVVANLLGNALRATRERTDGEVLLGIARRNRGGRRVARLTVTDNGVGLTADESTKIFERFYRAPGARATEGSGIGLTIARDIVRAHGGELTANSPGPGQGTTLTLTLPLS
ncbi:MAG: winged helix-turn-helix domain-containing protein [Propionibacteriaceae bacterium]|nr:winged helix-turn-helix domain-containing protein [Propionibacteriaceae bacterium]